MKTRTNKQLVNAIMNTGNPLLQAFVIEALHKYADGVIEWVPTDEDKRGLIVPEAWKHCAKCVKEILNGR